MNFDDLYKILSETINRKQSKWCFDATQFIKILNIEESDIFFHEWE